MGTDAVSLLPLETTAAAARAEETVDWRRDGRRPDDLVYIAMHTVKPAISVQVPLMIHYQTNHFGPVAYISLAEALVVVGGQELGYLYLCTGRLHSDLKGFKHV